MTRQKHHVVIKPVRPALPGIRFELDGDDVVTPGVGGWEQFQRPRRVAATEYVGTPLFELELPLLLTGLEVRPGVNRPVEGLCKRLVRFGRPYAKTGQPAILAVRGDLLRVPARLRWVITGITWGEQIRGPGGRRQQQALTLTLLEHRAPVVVRGPAARARARARR